ncbi:MAG: hypothetical protein LQ337_002235 [Flavoplaca oasis]|nr:MAG: hypothetical protein LQ337_002235 [Flavoplaca oasis]
MSSKAGNIFAGGWTTQKAAVLNSTKLPDKTRCKVCHKIQAIGNFSNKQQLDLKHKLAGQHGDKLRSPIAETIVCKKCTPGPNFEMTCCICNEPQGLERFSKNQRKDPDNARCLLCVNEHVTAPLAHFEQQEDFEEVSSDEDHSDNRSMTNPWSGASYRPGSEVNSATSGLRALNLSEHEESSPIWSDGGSYPGKSKGKQKENIHGRNSSPSIKGSESSVQIVTDTYQEKSSFARLPKAGNTGFANPPPGPPQRRPDDIIDQLKASGTGRVVSYSDDSDDDSEGSFGML